MHGFCRGRHHIAGLGLYIRLENVCIEECCLCMRRSAVAHHGDSTKLMDWLAGRVVNVPRYCIALRAAFGSCPGNGNSGGTKTANLTGWLSGRFFRASRTRQSWRRCGRIGRRFCWSRRRRGRGSRGWR